MRGRLSHWVLFAEAAVQAGKGRVRFSPENTVKI